MAGREQRLLHQHNRKIPSHARLAGQLEGKTLAKNEGYYNKYQYEH